MSIALSGIQAEVVEFGGEVFHADWVGEAAGGGHDEAVRAGAQQRAVGGLQMYEKVEQARAVAVAVVERDHHVRRMHHQPVKRPVQAIQRVGVDVVGLEPKWH